MTRSGAIVLTGATGWVGRTVLEHLAQNLNAKEFRQRVRAFAGSTGTLDLGRPGVVDINPLTLLPEFAKTESIDYLLHAAFLTPDRCNEIGSERYREVNQSITQLICASLHANSTARVVLFSSGAAAVAAASNGRYATGSPLEIYGQLKLQEERLLQTLCPTLVLRIYGLTGRFVREPQRYALGEFLCHAYHRESPFLRSRHKVVRGYIAAMDLAALAWEWLQSGDEAPRLPVEAVAETVELLALAEMISSMFGLPAVRSTINEDLKVDVYSASPQPLLSLLNSYGLTPTTLEKQIRDTYSGIISHFACHTACTLDSSGSTTF